MLRKDNHYEGGKYIPYLKKNILMAHKEKYFTGKCLEFLLNICLKF